MGLVRDECLIPTYDAPELGYVKESSNQQYVPDVFYKVTYSHPVLTLTAQPAYIQIGLSHLLLYLFIRVMIYQVFVSEGGVILYIGIFNW